MRRILATVLAIASISSPSTLAAQIGTQRSWGLGVALTAVGSVEDTPLDIRIPIRVGAGWRIEPEIGGYAALRSASSYSNGGGDEHTDVRTRNWRIGLSLARVIAIDSSTRFYVGARLGVERFSYKTELDFGSGPEEYSYRITDKHLGLLSGAETALGSRMTLGAEAGLNYIKGGDASVVLPAGSSVGIYDGGHQFITTGAIVVRWFRGHLPTPIP